MAAKVMRFNVAEKTLTSVDNLELRPGSQQRTNAFCKVFGDPMMNAPGDSAKKRRKQFSLQEKVDLLRGT
ncbi:hypothetical protein MRX96_023975 [Rhipicephalus microplus]